MKKILLSGMIGAFLIPAAQAGVIRVATFPAVHPKKTFAPVLKPVRHAGRDLGRVLKHAAKDAKAVAL